MYRIRRVLLLALMLLSFVAILMSASPEAFASPSFSRLEKWNGAGTLSTGGSFPMRVNIIVNQYLKFTGTLDEGRRGSAEISGGFTSGAAYGSVYFTTTQRLSGNLCPSSCNFNANFKYPDQSRMIGNWYAVPGGNDNSYGTFELARVG